MKTALMKNSNDIVIKDIEICRPDAGELLIKVDACGICGTDIMAAKKGRDDYKPFGHEVAGTVIDVGSGVTRFSIGDKIVLDSASACGRCKSCKNMRQEFCDNLIPLPFTGFSEMMIVPEITANLYDGMPAHIACLAEPLGVALDLFYTAEVKAGDVVLVSGMGPIGLMAVSLAKWAGASKIYACELSSARKKIELATKFGADEILEVDKISVKDYACEISPNKLLITSPPFTIPDLLSVAAKGSIAAFIGIADGDISFNANYFHFNKLQLRGSFASPAMRTPLAVKLLEDGIIDGASLVSHRFKLDDIGEAVILACENRADAVKIVVENE